jgi:hypothetical protein
VGEENMKLKISEIKPNPYKKEINGGKLNKDQIERIKSNLKELGLMGSIPVVKIAEDYHAVNGHHRLEALKQVYGKDFEVEVTIHKYTDEQLLRGMVIENLSQRSGEFREETENLKVIRNFLKKKPKVSVQPVNRNPKGGRPEGEESGSIRDIADWLNLNGEVMAQGKISQLLRISDKLAPELQEKIVKLKTQDKEMDKEPILKYRPAIALTKIDDHAEQKKVFNALKKSREKIADEQEKLITAYVQAPESVKERVVKGEIDFADITLEKEFQEMNIPKATKPPFKNPLDWVKKVNDKILDLSSMMPLPIVEKLPKSIVSMIWLNYNANLKPVMQLIEKKVKS